MGDGLDEPPHSPSHLRIADRGVDEIYAMSLAVNRDDGLVASRRGGVYLPDVPGEVGVKGAWPVGSRTTCQVSPLRLTA